MVFFSNINPRSFILFQFTQINRPLSQILDQKGKDPLQKRHDLDKRSHHQADYEIGQHASHLQYGIQAFSVSYEEGIFKCWIISLTMSAIRYCSLHPQSARAFESSMLSGQLSAKACLSSGS